MTYTIPSLCIESPPLRVANFAWNVLAYFYPLFRIKVNERKKSSLGGTFEFLTNEVRDKNRSSKTRPMMPCSHSIIFRGKYFVKTKYCVRAQPAKFAASHNILSDMICRFPYILTRRNLALGDHLPWTNMDWLLVTRDVKAEAAEERLKSTASASLQHSLSIPAPSLLSKSCVKFYSYQFSSTLSYSPPS